ncbi:uncharacterized protein LOC101850690 [Aplysia californica]|uniref:Uncharacterized protein LOC101850690 n=1 Tax=Aplysia californica TaxID=6500 RepID=A0ABM0K9B6_APLCA|nr:uncharacterized protein LOC101850690 [Aplysia californica]
MTRARAELAVYILIAGVLPVIAAFGIAGNVMSVCVLIRHGLDKSYNVMLVALACSDSSFLASMFFYGFVAAAGFQYPRNRGSFHFVFFEVVRVLDYGGGWVSFSMPVFITSERLLAVFFPLSLSRIVSPRRTSVAVVCLFVFLYGLMIFLTVRESLAYDYIRQYGGTNQSEGLIEAAIYRNTLDATDVIREFSKVVYGPFPICFVFGSCIILAIKIKMANRKRSQMTGGGNKGSGSSARVTATLLVVCMVYTVCSSIVFLCHSDVITAYYAKGPDGEMTGVVLGEIVNLFGVLNCSVNFVIYVVMNKNFRDTYVAMFNACTKK